MDTSRNRAGQNDGPASSKAGRIRRWIVLAATSVLAGCIVNQTKSYGGNPFAVRDDQAIVVVGITLEEPWPYPRFGVVLDRYDLARQEATGNCFTYDRIEARVPATPGATQFLAFEAPAGHYVYSPFNGAKFSRRDLAFGVPAGHAVYVGDFVLGEGGEVTLRSDLAAQRSAIAQALPRLPADLEAAATVAVAPAKGFLCTP
jgi:hypothetical protein